MPDPLVTRARSFGLELLERSSLYDNGVAVPYGDAAALSLVGLTSRAPAADARDLPVARRR